MSCIRPQSPTMSMTLSVVGSEVINKEVRGLFKQKTMGLVRVMD